MEKSSFGLTFSIVFIIFIGTISCSTSLRNVNEEYSREQVLLKNMIKSVRHVIRTRTETKMPYYCAFISSPPGGKPTKMMNMLRLTEKTVMAINTWPKLNKSYADRKHRNCSWCENIIIIGSATDFREIINKVNVTCTGARIELLVAIYEVLDSDDDAKKLAKDIVDFAWKRVRGFAIVFIPVDSRILVFKSERHVQFVRCEPEPPRLIFYLTNNTFVGSLPSVDRFDYNKCVVRIATTHCGLLARIVNSNGHETIAGIEGRIMRTVAEKQNYTLEVLNVLPHGIPINENKISNASLVREKVASDEADIGACSMWISYREDMKYTFSYSANNLVLVIPLPKYIPFDSILQTFSKPVWICILVSGPVGRMFIRMNRKSISSLMALALFLGVSVTSQSHGFVEKWQMTLWVVYGYLMTQSYIASLASVLNNPWMRRLETIEELAVSDIIVAGYTLQREYFKIDDKYKRIVETYIGIQEPEHSEMMDNPDKFLPDIDQTGILVDVLLLNSHGWLSGYYQLKEGIANLPLGMTVMARSRISLNEIDRTISTLMENGLIPKWTDEAMLPPGNQRISTDFKAPSPTLSLDEVAGIFVILFVGLLLSIIVFIFEVCKENASKNNSRLSKSRELS